ncbi:hypothetical protein [Paenibacillus dauci]|uniref:hypothetical protein n=1 Tax=Paenibacillus dauci TaxID=1567106 RepID=UPI0006193F4D|nr:hypothetical protein [Paenibacillus dauci]
MKNKRWTGLLAVGLIITGITTFVYTDSFAAELEQVRIPGERQQVETYPAHAKSNQYSNTTDPNVPPLMYFNVSDDYKLNIPMNLAQADHSTSQLNSSSYQDDPNNPITELKYTRGIITGKDNQLVRITYGLQDGKSEIRVNQSFNEDWKGNPVTIEEMKQGFDNPSTVLTELEINGYPVLAEETNHTRRQVFLLTEDYFYTINNAGGKATMEQLLYVTSHIKVD